jgi:hypothetical protein
MYTLTLAAPPIIYSRRDDHSTLQFLGLFLLNLHQYSTVLISNHYLGLISLYFYYEASSSNLSIVQINKHNSY